MKVVDECVELQERKGFFGMPDEHSLAKFRTVRGFLWRPLEIAGDERWLCRAAWREEFVSTPTGGQAGSTTGGEWVPVYWIDEV